MPGLALPRLLVLASLALPPRLASAVHLEAAPGQGAEWPPHKLRKVRAGRRQGEQKLKVLYVTSTVPKDVMPIDMVVKHQLHALRSEEYDVQAIVLQNLPPWMQDLPNRHQYRLAQMQAEGAVSFVEMLNYSRIADPKFLPRFFAQEATNLTLAELYAGDGERKQMLSNFFAMTTFLERCLDATEVELCAYFDPDILLYRNSSNLFDLAEGVFRDHPEFTVLQPPYGCYQYVWWKHEFSQNQTCFARREQVSSRHMIVNRTRLVASLPLRVKPRDIGRQYFEITITEAGRFSGQIMCGQEFFAVHPPSRYQKKLGPHLSFQELLGNLSVASGGSPQNVAAGTKELMRRFEAGKVVLNKYTINNEGCRCCVDMLPSAARLANGMAFFKSATEERRAALNDATFDWVVNCSSR